MLQTFELQGHRGARGRKPENTLPSFEAALDAGVTSIETDLHLTRDQIPVLCHDPFVDPRMLRSLLANSPDPAKRPRIRSLTLAQLRSYVVQATPDPEQFNERDAKVTPLAEAFCRQRGVHPFAIPALADLCDFLTEYAGPPGTAAGKTSEQRRRAQRAYLDLEIKRVAFHPEYIGDGFDGERPGILESSLVEVIRQAGLVPRTAVRSFDHRSVRAVLDLEPMLVGGVLIAGTTPAAPEELARAAGASVYCPSLDCVNESLVRRLHAHGIRVIPWTANHEDDWAKLLSWQVDGITTDYPDRLAAFLRIGDIVQQGELATSVAGRTATIRVPPPMKETELLTRLRETCLHLPETRETLKWGHPTFEAGKKMFAVLDEYDGRPCLAFRACPERRQELLADPRFFDAPYAAHHGWVCLHADGPLDWRQVQTLLHDSYRLVALKRMLAALADEIEPASPPKRRKPRSRPSGGRQNDP